MSLLNQRPLAVHVYKEHCLVLQLSRQGPRFRVEHFSQQHINSLSAQGLKRDGVVSALDYHATHYQKMSLEQGVHIEEQLLQKLPPQIKNPAAISYDYATQTDERHAETVVGQRSALDKLLNQLQPLNMPVQVVEPVYQSIVRAVNALLPYQWPHGIQFCHPMRWLILELRHPHSTLIYCENGVFQRFERVETAHLITRLSAPEPSEYARCIASFGDKAAQSALQRSLASHTKLPHIALSTAPFFEHNPTPIVSALDNEIVLLGLALRGFSQWHR